MTIHDILYTAHHWLSMEAFASPLGATPEETHSVAMAPGFTWNLSLGQLVQVVGLLVPMLIMWNKGQVRHAMQMRDIMEMRRDIALLQNNMSKQEDYLRQLPAIISGVQRNFGSSRNLITKNGEKIVVTNPLEESIRAELGEDYSDGVLDKVMDALKKVTHAE